MTAHTNKPVFFDPSAQRWRHVLRLSVVCGIAALVIFGTVAVGVIFGPGLPRLSLAPNRAELTAHPRAKTRTDAKRESAFQTAQHDLKQYLSRSLPPPVVARDHPFERIAFFVNWDDNSWVSLKRNLNDIDTITSEWLHLTGSRSIERDDPVKQRTVLDYLRSHRPGTKVVALVNNFTDLRWDSATLRTMLANPADRAAVIEQIEGYLRELNLAGVNIDFEAVPRKSQRDLLMFMRELYARLHPAGFEVSQSVPIDDGAFDLPALSAANDYLLLMSYDEHASDNEAGPIASQEWFTQNLKSLAKKVPSNKLVVGIGSYGYDWKQGKPPAEEISFQDALRIAAESEGDIQLDDASGNPGFEYYDDADRKHEVWFQDAVTAFNQVQAASRLSPRGFAMWRLGSEDPGVWNVLRHATALTSGVAHELETMHFEYDLEYRGKGEILRVTGTPQSGERRVSFDADIGLLTDDAIVKTPSGYIIERWGYDPAHVVALTFDDGPDPDWTPRILDILREKQVRATFFVIGSNAESNPDLLERIVDEGHEIGNHTYTHPNIGNASDRRIDLELNATQRLFESRLGLRSLLFRPPYAEDVEPETPDQVRPLLLTSSLGYYSVGMQIDPDDWARPGANEIVKRVIDSARAGEGNVVLLHDSGGDRSQTIEALPRLIDELRASGFNLVTIADLLKLPRDQLMPPLENKGDVRVRVEGAGFTLVNAFDRVLRTLFITGIALGISRFFVVFGLAVYRRLRGVHKGKLRTPASIVVPAYNEERVIERTIRSLLASNCEFEVIVVDDGSTDRTAEVVRSAFKDIPRVRLFSQPNGGKASALNLGVAEARHEIIVVLDADTVFTPDTVAQLVRHFDDARIGAVAGNAKVGNRVNVLTRWQALEYITSQNLDRRAFEVLNCITVVPGAIGAWRRSVVLKAGGFTHDTLAEDADLTMRVVRNGHRVLFEERAVAYTEAPQSAAAFLKQRFRWMFGTLQASFKHRGALFRKSGGTLGSLALPNVWVFQIFFPLVSPVMDLLMIWTAAQALFGHTTHPTEIDFMSSALAQTLYYYVLFLAIDLGTATLAYLFEPDEDWRLLLWLPLQRFCYRQMIYYVAIKSLATALRGPRVGWGKLQRYGSVQTRSH